MVLHGHQEHHGDLRILGLHGFRGISIGLPSAPMQQIAERAASTTTSISKHSIFKHDSTG